MIHEPILAVGELTTEDFRRDVLAGLSLPTKMLPCKYLYDERGSELFDEICELEEYYPTRTELAILKWHFKEIAALPGSNCRLVELGSGSGLKTRLLLEHLDHPAAYVPVDVARTQLFQCADRLAREHPGTDVQPVCADYTNDFELPEPPSHTRQTVIFFPGSTIGNFEPLDAVEFLGRMAHHCGDYGGILVGVDLKKSLSMLKRAYNDSRGVTAEFNLNLLDRINRELDGDIDRSQFWHHAVYNETAGRIEMHLVSARRQSVMVGHDEFHFAAGESIVTEHSYKYTPGEFRRLAARAGLDVARCWTDDRRWFSVQYLVPHHSEKTFFATDEL
jgi:dimethylhistidine N-methyltransferase